MPFGSNYHGAHKGLVRRVTGASTAGALIMVAVITFLPVNNTTDTSIGSLATQVPDACA